MNLTDLKWNILISQNRKTCAIIITTTLLIKIFLENRSFILKFKIINIR